MKYFYPKRLSLSAFKFIGLMKEKIQKRLQVLKSEFEAGQKVMTELEEKQANLRQTLLRISGAIQVLEEVLNETLEENGSLTDVPTAGSGTIAAPNPSDPLML
jgi:predicted nuclease with TOPRIM domain